MAEHVLKYAINLYTKLPWLIEVAIMQEAKVDNMKKTGQNEYANEFFLDYETNYIKDILDIHNYVMKKHNIFNNF